MALDRNPLDNLRYLCTTSMVMKRGVLYRIADNSAGHSAMGRKWAVCGNGTHGRFSPLG